MLQHLHLDVDVELALEEVRQPGLNTRMQLLAPLHINLKGLPLAHIRPKLRIVTRKYELHELLIAKTPAVVQIVELHHQLRILDAELRPVALLQVLIDVNSIDELVAIPVNPTERRIRLEVVQVREVLPCFLDAELQICEVAKEVHQFLLRLPSQHIDSTYSVLFKCPNLLLKYILNSINSK